MRRFFVAPPTDCVDCEGLRRPTAATVCRTSGGQHRHATESLTSRQISIAWIKRAHHLIRIFPEASNSAELTSSDLRNPSRIRCRTDPAFAVNEAVFPTHTPGAGPKDSLIGTATRDCAPAQIAGNPLRVRQNSLHFNTQSSERTCPRFRNTTRH